MTPSETPIDVDGDEDLFSVDDSESPDNFDDIPYDQDLDFNDKGNKSILEYYERDENAPSGE